jgi:hypothetical protein
MSVVELCYDTVPILTHILLNVYVLVDLFSRTFGAILSRGRCVNGKPHPPPSPSPSHRNPACAVQAGGADKKLLQPTCTRREEEEGGWGGAGAPVVGQNLVQFT